MGMVGLGKGGIILGDPVPWFSAPLIADGAFNLSVAPGRWIVLSFLRSPANPRVEQQLAEVFRDSDLFDGDRDRLLRHSDRAAGRPRALPQPQHCGVSIHRRL